MAATPKRAAGWAIALALSPAGAALDRFCVRFLAHSPVVWIFTRAEGAAYNRPLLLTTTGRKTGRPRTVVLPYFESGSGSIVLVGSRGGMRIDPHWARNLVACPQARIHLRRREHRVRVRLAEGDERSRLWDAIAQRAPIYDTYAERAAPYRTIPLFVLEPESGRALSDGDGPGIAG